MKKFIGFTFLTLIMAAPAAFAQGLEDHPGARNDRAAEQHYVAPPHHRMTPRKPMIRCPNGALKVKRPGACAHEHRR